MPYHNLDVFKKSYDLSLEMHRLTLGFPRWEEVEIGRQLRKASKSITANLVEGMARQKSPKDLVRFLRDAMGSCDEVRLWLDYAKDLGYMKQEQHTAWIDRYCEVGRMLNGLISKWSRMANPSL
jgi:four helix bundle protein